MTSPGRRWLATREDGLHPPMRSPSRALGASVNPLCRVLSPRRMIHVPCPSLSASLYRSRDLLGRVPRHDLDCIRPLGCELTGRPVPCPVPRPQLRGVAHSTMVVGVLASGGSASPVRQRGLQRRPVREGLVPERDPRDGRHRAGRDPRRGRSRLRDPVRHGTFPNPRTGSFDWPVCSRSSIFSQQSGR